METKTDCDVIRTIEKNKSVYETPFLQLDRDLVEFPNGVVGEYSIVHQGIGLGAVAIPFTSYRGIGYIGLARQYRYPLGRETVEFPRGGTKNLESAEAAREVVEEMGFNPSTMKYLGSINPDSGLLSSKVGAWVAFAPSGALTKKYVESETGLRSEWVTEGAFEGMVLNGHITCGITLAAYALFRSKRASFGPSQ